MSLSYSQCLIFLGSREDEKMRPPSKPNPRRLLGHSLHDFSGTTYEEAKALRAFTRTATVFVAGIRINASLSATSGLSVACFGKTLAPPCLNSNRVISLRSLLPEKDSWSGDMDHSSTVPAEEDTAMAEWRGGFSANHHRQFVKEDLP
ncbi:hypothetical protein JHK85_012797 [Glycine max]|nr:hypothetical protein JHK85_012797 [Glycine max]